MKRKSLVFFAFTALMAFSSCQKEISLEDPIVTPGNPDPGTGNTDKTLPGVYDFVGITTKGTSTIRMSQMGVTVSSINYIDYTSINNKGTYTFTDTDITATNISYDLSATLRSVIQMTGFPDETVEQPFEYSMPAYSANATYTLKGADSLVSSGSIYGAEIPGGTTATTPGAVHYGWSGDTLVLTIGVKQSFTTEYEGVPATQAVDVISSTKLKKK